MSHEEVREKVLEKVSPSDEEAEESLDMFSRIQGFIEEEFGREAELMGSTAKGTFMAGDKDLDIFVFFEPEVARETLEEEGLAIGEAVFEHFDGQYHVEYAEHPYTKGTINGFEVEIVPAYAIDDPNDIKSAVDRTPFHTRWVNEALDKAQRKEVVMLKAFLKAQGLYGSSLDTERFSGYLREILIAEYGSFTDLLAAYEADPTEYDLGSLRRAGQGGDKLPVTVHERLEETLGVPIYEGYGLTETTATTHTVRTSTLGDRLGSVGQPVGHTDSKVVDRAGEQVAIGEEGEIVLRGPQVMRGYYDDPEATEEAFTDDGYFRTGDRGSRDADNYYYVHGREKEMILTAGYNVYPAEVEEVLYDHPSVGEAAVFALPDERRGETVAAAVTPSCGGEEPTPDELKEYVLSELAPYKHPRTVLVLPELPRTGSGKVQKRRLREAVEENEAG
jgi:hypothetical protein